ncbi:MAG: protein deglycase HchA [Rothia sp. (in: high G+C Gram-positive bacteria)]|uniref:glyoxalase III HchA n=1 Tax=Rothia sp. (in: high G+C Gram-positive bacteria) TaxID=1885016 RepID=UPI0026E05FBE|nr:glyoxalase III HchA [Rothia sp. (in: high G+C Gram-positive bacteria)]MDO5749897.1 protein deglycase HchA [Rothia sp. (in: high G+C Gram-positive bacteria)]
MTTEDRNPSIDPAENNAFFPSPYSLSQYTAPKTDFDGVIAKDAYKGDKKVLVIGTEERYMLMQNGKFFSTGNHPVESLLPMHHILEAGFEIEVATLTGAPVKFEWWAFPHEDEAVTSAWAKLEEQMKAPKRLADIELNDDYLGVLIPGGHGAMLNLPESKDVQAVLDWALNNDKLMISLCHGPAAFLAAGYERESNPLAGYKMCVFPDSLDAGANIEIGYLPGKMPWALGEALKAQGIEIVNDTMSGATHRDRNLLTGDSPLASNALGKMAVEALLEKVA